MGKVELKYWDVVYEACRLNEKMDKYDKEGTVVRGRSRSLVDKSLERCILVDQESIKETDDGAANDGDSPSCSDFETDPDYLTFMANAEPEGNSYVLKAGDRTGLHVSLKHEKEDQSDDQHRYDRKRNLITDWELEIHGVEKGHENVREKDQFGSSKTQKTTARKSRKTSIVEEQKIDGISSQKQGREDKDLGSRKRSSNMNIVPSKKHKTQSGSIFIDKKIKIEPKEEFDTLGEEIWQGEVEILENVKGSSSHPFVPSLQYCLNLEDPCQPKPDAIIIDSGYRKEVLNILMRPYDEQEYKKLWKDIKMQLPSDSTDRPGKSLLSLHKAVNREIKRTNHDKDKKLNIMRGFFFWLEHLTRQDAFQPWEDAECLQTMPGSS